MSKHTPGPWVADVSEPNDCVVFAKGGEWVTNVDGGLREDGTRVVAFDQSIADSHLIAAAPDLLEACRGIETVAAEWLAERPDPLTDGWDMAMDALKAARAAIKKATTP